MFLRKATAGCVVLLTASALLVALLVPAFSAAHAIVAALPPAQLLLAGPCPTGLACYAAAEPNAIQRPLAPTPSRAPPA